MAEDNSNFQQQGNYNLDLMKLQNLEQTQRLLKDRLMLIGQNLIDLKESQQQEITDIKKQTQNLQQQLKRLISFIETASGEFEKYAKKSDVEILAKQAKMFQPLEFVRKSDLQKEIKKIKE